MNALAAIPGGLDEVIARDFRFPARHLRPEAGCFVPLQRGRCAGACETDAAAACRTRPKSFQSAGPLEADRLLPAYKDSADEVAGIETVAALKDSPALTGLRIDAIKAAPGQVSARRFRSSAEELYQLINVDAAKQKEKLESLLASLKDGDIRRGQAVFNSTKAACAACHPFGYLGGNVGPDLTQIGQIRQERDLLEAIVFPSASFVRSFEPVVVATQSGKTYNGLLKSETADEIVLATGPKEVARVARDDIEEMRPSTVSVMPSGLDQQLVAAGPGRSDRVFEGCEVMGQENRTISGSTHNRVE